MYYIHDLLIPGLLNVFLFRYDIMRHLKMRSVKDLSKLGDAKQVKKALLDSIDTAPLNYFIVSIFAGSLGLYGNFVDQPAHKYEGSKINDFGMQAVILFSCITALLLKDVKKFFEYSEDFYADEETVVDQKMLKAPKKKEE